MGYYTDLRDKILQVEQQGFNPYTQSYESQIARLETPSTNTPETTESALNMSQMDTTVSDPALQTTQPTSAPVDYKTMDIQELYDNFRVAQAKATRGFQETFPDVDVAGILGDLESVEDFSHENLDQYYSQYVKKYGKKEMKPSDVKKYSPEYYDLLNEINRRDIESGGKKEGEGYTRGAKESTSQEEIFSYRSMGHRRYQPSEGQRPYLYLDEIELDKKLDEKNKK